MANERVALITGGARGIGRGIGLDLADAGWDIALCYRTSEADANATRDSLAAKGARVHAVRADVSSPEQARALVDEVSAKLGRIDALINCAGPYHRAKLLEETPEGWRSMFANNLDSVFYTARYAAPGMIERRFGRIVAFSMAGAQNVAANTAVTAHFIAKMGVVALMRALAKELAPHGVTANVVSPGFVDSQSAPDEELAAMAKRIPAGHVGKVDDCVAAVRYLLSDDASYVTGTNVMVSGGWGL